MDGDGRRASQYGQSYQLPGPPRSSQSHSMVPASTDRFALPATPARSDPTRHAMSRSYLPGYPQYGFQDPQYGSSTLQSSSPMQGVEMQYPPTYVQDISRQQAVAQAHPQQQYPQYATGSLLPSTHQANIYEHVPGYQQRQSAAIEVMSSQMGALPQYVPQQDQSSLQLQQSAAHFASSQPEHARFHAPALPRASLQSQYGAGGSEYGIPEQQTPQRAAQQNIIEQEKLQEEFREYGVQLRSTFGSIVAGRLTEASEKIVPISRWLVNAVPSLGMHHDDQAHYSERLEIWREINLCWEALGQKQKDVCEESLRTGRAPTDVLSAETIHRILDELIALCDTLEQYGLVDYEMGVAEEQITHIFFVCLDLLQRPEFGSQGRPPQT